MKTTISALIGLLPTFMNCSRTDTDCSMFRANSQHTGVYETKGVREYGGVKWTFMANGEVYYLSSPAISKGVICVVYNDSLEGDCVYAVDIKTGHEKWRFRSAYALQSSPAIDNGVVFFSDYAVDIETGKKGGSSKCMAVYSPRL